MKQDLYVNPVSHLNPVQTDLGIGLETSSLTSLAHPSSG